MTASACRLFERRRVFCGIISGTARCVNTKRSLTHSLDYTEEGLAMQATRIHAPAIDPITGQAAEDTPLCKCGCGQAPPFRRRKGRERLRYVKGHLQQHLRALAAQDFWTKVNVRGQDECWPWTGKVNKKGYGAVKWHNRTSRAHRIAYLLAVGPIPDDLALDHLCHERGGDCPGGPRCLHRHCCNPAHLKPVPGDVNTMRGMSPPALNALKVECIRGHPFTEANTRIRSNGGRDCRECRREDREAQRRKQGVA